MNLLYDFFFIVGILFASIFAFVMYKSHHYALHSKLLSLVFVILVIVLLESYSVLHKLDILTYITFLPASLAKFLLGALLLLYIKSIFYESNVVIKNSWKIFTPVIVFAVFYSLPTLIAFISKKYFLNYLDILFNHNAAVRMFSDIAFLIYLVLCFVSFFKLKNAIECTYSNITHNNFIWIRYILIIAIIIIVLDFIFSFSQTVYQVDLGRSQNIIMLLLVISIIYTAYFGLHQSKVLVPYFLLENSNTHKTQQKTPILDDKTKTEFEVLEQKLKTVFKEDRPYLETHLTLNKLSDLTLIPTKKLSVLLNQHMGISFYDFVNNYRVNAFKEAINSNKYNQYTIESIAVECGFKSKASFYRIFKLKTNMSPLAYKKAHKTV